MIQNRKALKILSLNDLQRQEIIGKTLVELILNPDYGISKYLDHDFEKNIELLLNRIYLQISYMKDDPIFNIIENEIINNKIAKEVWKKLNEVNEYKEYNYESRKISFKHFGIPFELRYTIESLSKYKRFEIVEYIPTNDLIKLLAKFF